MTDPREDALAKAREALTLGRRWTTEHLGNCSEDDTPDEVRKIKEDLADIEDAIAALTPSPTPYVRPAESAVVLTLIDALTGLESSYEEGEGVSYARLEARSAIKTAQDFLAAPTPYVRPAGLSDLWRDLCEKDDRTSPEEYPDMALITFDELCAIVAAANEVRPAAGADLFPNLEQPQCDQCGRGLVTTFDGLRCESCGADQNPDGGLVDLAKAGEVARKFYRRPAAEIRAEIERAKAAPSHIRTDAEKAGNRGYLSGLTFALTPPTQEPRVKIG